MNWKSIFRIHGTGGNAGNPWLNEMREMDPYELYIYMNPKAAADRRLADGQEVIVESANGSTKGRIRLTQLIHPEVIGFPGNYGAKSTPWLNPADTREGAWFNALLGMDERLYQDPISAGLDISPKVCVYAAN
jgi:anaerobic selenocysteine-containing dehydrogenase